MVFIIIKKYRRKRSPPSWLIIDMKLLAPIGLMLLPPSANGNLSEGSTNPAICLLCNQCVCNKLCVYCVLCIVCIVCILRECYADWDCFHDIWTHLVLSAHILYYLVLFAHTLYCIIRTHWKVICIELSSLPGLFDVFQLCVVLHWTEHSLQRIHCIHFIGWDTSWWAFDGNLPVQSTHNKWWSWLMIIIIYDLIVISLVLSIWHTSSNPLPRHTTLMIMMTNTIVLND